jgi:hypothetical protein
MPAFSFEDDLLDARVRVETTLGSTFEGAVFAAYKPAQYLVLETPAGEGRTGCVCTGRARALVSPWAPRTLRPPV